MSKRSFTARQALATLLVAVCVPFLSVAKPPDLPATSKVECKEESTGKTLFGVGVNSDAGIVGTIHLPERTLDLKDVLRIFCRSEDPGVPGTVSFFKVKVVEANGSIIFVPCNEVPCPLEELVDLLRPRIEDTIESSWRTLMRWLPITCAPNCCETRTSRLAVIEVLSFAPTLQEEDPHRRMSELLNTSEHFGPIEYEWERIWFTDQPFHLTPQRVHGGVGSGDELSPPVLEPVQVMPRLIARTPRAAVRALPFAEFMCLVEDNWELLPPPLRCGGSCPEEVAPPRVGEISKFTLCPRECLLDNLRRPACAQQFCRDAEHCCKAGNTCCATVRCFAEAAQLCPGSSCAAACAARLRELIAGQAQTIVQTSAKEVKEDEKKSSWPRIEIKLTIEIKR